MAGLTHTMREQGTAPAVFLDRDGVLNESSVIDGVPRPPREVADFKILPGVQSACNDLKDAGFRLVVVTNQPDVSRGTLPIATLDAMHNRLRREVCVDEIVTCLHDDADDCSCRKPRPGMILDSANRLGIDLAMSYLVGDRWRDVEAAKNAGVRPIFVDRNYTERVPSLPAELVVGSLRAAADLILLTRTNIEPEIGADSA